jgi:hypothetical protein
MRSRQRRPSTNGDTDPCFFIRKAARQVPNDLQTDPYCISTKHVSTSGLFTICLSLQSPHGAMVELNLAIIRLSRAMEHLTQTLISPLGSPR